MKNDSKGNALLLGALALIVVTALAVTSTRRVEAQSTQPPLSVAGGRGWSGGVDSSGVQVPVSYSSTRDGVASRVSIYNSGTNVVYVAVNTSLTELGGLIAGGIALPVPPGTSYNFDKLQTGVSSVSLRCGQGNTSFCYVAFE